MLQCGYIPSSLVSSLSGPHYTPPTGAQEDVNPRTSVLDDLSSSLSFGITCIQVNFFALYPQLIFLAIAFLFKLVVIQMKTHLHFECFW